MAVLCHAMFSRLTYGCMALSFAVPAMAASPRVQLVDIPRQTHGRGARGIGARSRRRSPLRPGPGPQQAGRTDPRLAGGRRGPDGHAVGPPASAIASRRMALSCCSRSPRRSRRVRATARSLNSWWLGARPRTPTSAGRRTTSRNYKVADRQAIEASQRDNIEQYLRAREPSNVEFRPPTQDTLAQPGSTRSEIDLRGFGPDRTLVLIDGRRLPSLPSGQGEFDQPDLNGRAARRRRTHRDPDLHRRRHLWPGRDRRGWSMWCCGATTGAPT